MQGSLGKIMADFSVSGDVVLKYVYKVLQDIYLNQSGEMCKSYEILFFQISLCQVFNFSLNE